MLVCRGAERHFPLTSCSSKGNDQFAVAARDSPWVAGWKRMMGKPMPTVTTTCGDLTSVWHYQRGNPLYNRHDWWRALPKGELEQQVKALIPRDLNTSFDALVQITWGFPGGRHGEGGAAGCQVDCRQWKRPWVQTPLLFGKERRRMGSSTTRGVCGWMKRCLFDAQGR